MSNAQNLRKQLEASLQPKLAKANPLRTIGFSHEILRLGLSEDELYDYAYATARSLFARVHPDRAHTTEIKEHQARVSEAFDLLKDRTLFNRWLRDFGEELSASTEEFNAMRQANEKMRSVYEADHAMIKKLSGELQTTKTGRDAVTKSFCNYLLMRSQFFGGAKVCSADQSATIRLLRFKFYFPKDKTKPKQGETIFSVNELSDKCIREIPGAKHSNELVLAILALRHFTATHPTLPFVGLMIREIKSVSGHFDEKDYQPKGQRVILGSVSAEDAETLQFGVNPCMSVELDSLVSLLRNELYPSALLVTNKLDLRSPSGTEADAQKMNMRLKISKALRQAYVSDVVIDVRSSDPT